MKIQPARVDAFLARPDQQIAAILVYGPDSGLVSERVNQLARSEVSDLRDPFRVVELTAATLRKDPVLLDDEARALSMIGGRRVIFIREAVDSLTQTIRDFLDRIEDGALVLLEAGELGPRSSLRKLFEEHQRGAAIACYPDDARSLPGVIRSILGQHGLTLDADAAIYLQSNLGSDRSVTRSELEKLALYMGDAKRIGLEDAMACVGDSAASSMDAIIFSAAEGRQADLDLALERAAAEGLAPITILRSAARHLIRLQLARGHMDAGANPDEALRRLKPPVIFKAVDAFKRQLGLWSREKLARGLSMLTAAEIDCKTTGMPAEAIAARTMLRLAQAAMAK